MMRWLCCLAQGDQVASDKHDVETAEHRASSARAERSDAKVPVGAVTGEGEGTVADAALVSSTSRQFKRQATSETVRTETTRSAAAVASSGAAPSTALAHAGSVGHVQSGLPPQPEDAELQDTSLATPVSPREARLPVDMSSNVDKVEEWLSFSLSGSRCSPQDSPQSQDPVPMPPGSPSALDEYEGDTAAKKTREVSPLEPGSASETAKPVATGAASEPATRPPPAAAPAQAPAVKKSSSGKSHASARSRETPALPAEVLSSLQLTLQAKAQRCEPAPPISSLSAPAQPSMHPIPHSAAAVEPMRPQRSSGLPLGDPDSSSVYGSGGLAPQSTSAAGHPITAPAAISRPDSPLPGGVTPPSVGGSSAHSPSPRSTTRSAGTPSRIGLDGVLSMLQNRTSDPTGGAATHHSLPIDLSAALASMHAQSALSADNIPSSHTSQTNLPPTVSPRRGPYPSPLHSGHATTVNIPLIAPPRAHPVAPSPLLPPEGPGDGGRKVERSNSGGSAIHPPSSALKPHAHTTTAAHPLHAHAPPSLEPSQPLLSHPGAPIAAAMKRRVTQLFFTEAEGTGGDAQWLQGDANEGTQSSANPAQATSPCNTLSVTEPDDTYSTSSNVSLITPLRYHTEVNQREFAGAPKPVDEESRMEKLCNLNVVGTDPEPRFDRLTALVAQVFHMPMVVVTLVESDRQWFKSVVGLPGVSQTDRKSSFCAWTLLPRSPECLVVMDAQNDTRFRNNPLVANPPFIQFYAGCPLVATSGARLGSLCVIDTRKRYFTAEDCNLLCNMTEIVVRELEARSVAERRMFGKEHAEEDSQGLRAPEAWDVGLLLVHVGDQSWQVRHANARASEVLGISDLAAFINTDFWDFFALKAPPSDAHPSEHFRLQLLEGQDFSFEAKAFTEEGQKLWITCDMHSGTQSQVDDYCPLVSVPVDLASEPGVKVGYWFVAVRPMAEKPKCWIGKLQPKATTTTAFFHRHSDVSSLFPPDALRGLLLLSPLATLPRSQLQLAILAPASRAKATAPPSAADVTAVGERMVAEVATSDAPEGLEECVGAVIAQWKAAGLQEAVHAFMDVRKMEIGDGALMLLRAVPYPIVMSLRGAMHEGLFKRPPSAEDIHNGVVTVDVPLAIEVSLHLARSLELMHAAGLVHGDLSDASVVCGAWRHRVSPEERWELGMDVVVALATIGVPPSAPESQVPVYLDDLAATRPDLALFYAPERFDENEALSNDLEPSVDIWGLGIIMVYLLRISLPVLREGPLALMKRAQESTLLTEVLQLEEQQVSAEVSTLIQLCLSPDPRARPSAARLAAGLQHVRSTLPDTQQASDATTPGS